LESGLPSFPRDSTCPVVLENTNQGGLSLSHTRLSLSTAALSRVLLLKKSLLTPRPVTRPGQPVSHNPRKALARMPLPSLQV
jgi:hypothetical protein